MMFRSLRNEDVPCLWRINEEGLPGTGKVSEDAIIDLIDFAELTLGAFEKNKLLGFVICLPPKTKYGSLNYAWFNQRYDDFLYVDRIAVSTKHRNRKIGTLLYEKVIKYAQEQNRPVVAEVSLKPPNPKSMRFHGRHDFNEVGIFNHENKSVTMMFREC